ncbi:MAG: hypothetical protein RIQ89_315 [Bacteroidota bacterium]
MTSAPLNYRNDLRLRFPVIMAPMFLVTNEPMLTAAMDAGIIASFPSLNYRKVEDLNAVLGRLNSHRASLKNAYGNFAVNLIVQKTNIFYKKHLAACVAHQVPIYITSLGNPTETIQQAHAYGAKVYCDVTNELHAQKCFDAGCDGFIAVSQGAGGHAGPNPLLLLIESLKKKFPAKPIWAAGGIATGTGILGAMAAGASAAYIGTRFIASTEAAVSQAYKDAIVNSKMDDIIMSNRISGTPCTIINTPYAQKIGTTQNWFEHWMSNNATTKKYFKMLVQKRGMDWLEKAIRPGNYNSLWCAGKSVELIQNIQPIAAILHDMEMEFKLAIDELNAKSASWLH